MKGIVGLVEYTVTGAFVWLLFLVFLGWVALDSPTYDSTATLAQVWTQWAQQFVAVPAKVLESSKLVQDVMPQVIGGAFFVTVFVTGALLDLAASALFVVVETRWAQKMFRRANGWLPELIRDYGALISSDYHDLTRERENSAKPAEWEPAKYRRVTAFLFSYILAVAKPGQVDEVRERLKLWRVNQAICLSLIVLTIALALWTLHTWEGRDPFRAFFLGFALPLALLGLTYLSMRVSFYRLSIAMESALYLSLAQSRASRTAAPATQEPPAVVPIAEAGTREPRPVQKAA
jgi:hypothetical protein